MATYLLTWNSKPWQWDNLGKCIKKIKARGYYKGSWSCGNTKKICPDDRVFLIKLGPQPRGIVASGWAVSEVYEGKHWNRQERAKMARYIDVYFDIQYLIPKKRCFLVIG